MDVTQGSSSKPQFARTASHFCTVLRRGSSRAALHQLITSRALARVCRGILYSSLFMCLSSLATADAQEEMLSTPMGRSGGGYAVDLLWTMVAAILVFFMQAGFALVEAGFTRVKNVANILMKNLSDLAVGSLAYWAVGFGLMFGRSNGFCGTSHFMLGVQPETPATFAFLFFQTAFCATAATIVSGAIAERTRFRAYVLFSLLSSALIYPIFGSWAWGGLFSGGGFLERPMGGLLDRLDLPPFIDFAGSTVVHSVGGWMALAGALVVGPRIGKFGASGRVQPIWGHNLALSTLGVFILWFGWFGFNAGSTTGVTGGGLLPYDGVGKAFAMIAVNTNLAACAGLIAAMALSMWTVGKPDVGLTLNGALAGLVSITAGCATSSPLFAIVTGCIAGALVVWSVRLFDALQIDDPVGAISVHGVCGAWGTLAAGLFHAGGLHWAQVLSQLVGMSAAFIWSFGVAYLLFRALEVLIGLRVSPQDELDGLDLAEHGAEAYPTELSQRPYEVMGNTDVESPSSREYTGFISDEG